MSHIKLPSNPDLPATYEIRIRSKIDAGWSDWFDQMILNYTTDEEGTVTTLVGTIKDQAALYGLIKKIRDLGLTILSINQVESEDV